MPLKLDRKCLDKVIVYENKERNKDGFIIINRIIGIPAESKTKDRYVYEALGNNKFSKKKIKVPSNLKKQKYTKKRLEIHKKWLAEFYCTSKIVPKNIEGFEQFKWEKKMRKHYLRINDILKMKTGDKIKLLILDRNVSDSTTAINKELKSYKPKYFYRKSLAVYTHDKELKGSILFNFEGAEPMDFEFEIEYKRYHWYPLTNGKLPKKESQNYSHFGDKAGKHYTQFPKTTLVGWRGPAIRYELLKDLPKVYWFYDP